MPLIAAGFALAGCLFASRSSGAIVTSDVSDSVVLESSLPHAGIPSEQYGLFRDPLTINTGLLEIGPEREVQQRINLSLLDRNTYEASLLIKGDFQQTDTGTLSIRGLSDDHKLSPTGIHSTAMLVTGEAKLNGRLEVGFAEGFVPEIGDRFALISAREITGTISTFDQASLDGNRFLGLNYRRDPNGAEPVMELITLETPRRVSGSVEDRNLVLVTHGTDSSADDWVNDIAEAISNQALPGWEIVTLDWRDFNGGGADPFADFEPAVSANNSINIGESLVRWLKEQGRTFDNVHLLGHSSGVWLADAIADALQTNNMVDQVHLTAMEAFTPWLGIRKQGPGPLALGETADFMDHYFHKHLLVPFTDDRLQHAVNVDLTELADFRLTIEGAFGSHSYPHEWYLAAAQDPQNPEVAIGGLGPRLAAEFSGVFPQYGDQIGEGDLIATQKRFSDTFKAYNFSWGNFFKPINLFEDSQNFVTGEGKLLSDGSFTGTIDEPVILTSLLQLKEPFSAIEFDYSMLSEAPTLLTVYFDGEQIYQFDSTELAISSESSFSTGWISLQHMYEPGSYSLTFRIDPLSLNQVDFQISDLQFFSWEPLPFAASGQSTPEPSSLLLLGLGCLAMNGLRRRRRAQQRNSGRNSFLE